MFFYDDAPSKGTAQDNTSDGFPEPLGRARIMAWLCLLSLMAWLCLFSFVGFVAWCVK